MTHRVHIGWVGVFSLCLASCSGESDRGGPTSYPTSGQVLVNGEPVGGVLVTFHPVAPGGEATGASGTTDARGTFVLETFSQGDGAPAGDYKVTLIWPVAIDRMLVARTNKGKGDMPPGDKLQGKFAKPDTSGITAHVDKGKNVLKPFDLQATVLDEKAIEDAMKAERRKMRGK